MNVTESLKAWGLNIPDNIWYPEYLLNNKKSNFFYIDKLPLLVPETSSQKFDQQDIFFQKVMEGKIPKKIFLSLEIKYRNILTKLWLYNKVFVESNLFGELNIDVNLKKIDKRYLQTAKELQKKFSESCFWEITQKHDLELLIQLGARDIADTAFYFSEYEIVIIPSWSCFMIYMNNLSQYQIVKDIVTSEGLFLREPV